MIIAFFSNYLSHHQLPFSEEMNKIRDCEYYFISCEPFNDERIKLGWKSENKKNYELRPYESQEDYIKAKKLALDCDIMIWGSASYEYIKIRKKSGKIYFRYSERLLKSGIKKSILSLNFIRYIKLNILLRSKNAYLLSASAYAPFDYKITMGKFANMYKWGYFPETKQYESIDNLILNKDKISILWTGRLIEWKHPEFAIELAKKLKDNGVEFNLNIIGDGPLKIQLSEMIKHFNLKAEIHLLGAMTTEEVRMYMEKSKFFLFTSDYNEGWGAVLNEAMNSGCVVFSSDAIGSTKYLIEDGINGFEYCDGNMDDLINKFKCIYNDIEKSHEIGKNAYLTIKTKWSAKESALRFFKLCQCVTADKNYNIKDVPLSKAKVIIPKKIW